jgi:hypothetical protein
MRKTFFMVWCFVVCTLSSASLFSQSIQASISGFISNDNKSAISGATVVVKNESTGFTSKTVSNEKGEYTFKELPLGSPYSIKVSSVGFGEQNRTGYTLNQGDALKVDFSMTVNVQSLQVIEVVGAGLKNKIQTLGSSTTINARNINRLPVNGRNFTSLLDLSPLSRGGSLSGQLGSSTNYNIDGMTAKNPTSAGSTTSRSGSPYAISIEAVREFKIVTNQYDVIYGRSGGGTVSAVTKSGTNNISGSVFNYTRANWLSSPYNIRGIKIQPEFNTSQFGFTLGGPIIKDKMHYFLAWDHQADSRPLIVADIESAADETRFNVTKTTLENFVRIAQDKYGVAKTGQFGTFDKNRKSDAALLRLDWQLDSKNLLTIRNNFTYDLNKLGLEDNTAINIYESYGNDYNIDNSLLATLRTSINTKTTNELKLQYLYTYQNSSPGDQLPSANIPRSIVEGVTSTVAGGTRSTNIQMGGHRFAQEYFKNHVVQLVNNLYYNTSKVKYTFGTDFMMTFANSKYGSELNGRFHYTVDAAAGLTALDKFERLQPYRYFREVPLMADPSVDGVIANLGAYGQMQTELGKGLSLTAGLRIDYGIYPKSEFNQLVYDELKIRTDNKLKSFAVQPRFQLTWDVNDQRKDIIRIGAGIFASDINNYMLINNLVFDGKHSATVDVRGAAVPVPNFASYRQDPSTIPSLQAFQLATINTNAPDAEVPVMYKANISYNKFITDKFRLGISGYMTLGRNNYMYVDRNMAINPFFTLNQEGGRGVYVPLSTMPANGAGDWLQGRISQKLGRVLEMNSQGKVNNFAFVFDGVYQYFKDGEINFSYTYNDTKDNTSYNGNVANTATLVLPVRDDPRNLSAISYSDNQFKHKVVLYGSSPTFYGFSLGIRYSGIGGTRYSLLSGANSNADFVAGQNDLAFIFDKNNPSVPQNVRTGIQAILDNPNASQSIKDFINEYSGKIAERNGGENGFYGLLDLRLTKKFNMKKGKNLEFSCDLFNAMNLINKDYGANKSLGSQAIYALGIPASGTTPALPGFDRVNQNFNYRVNSSGVPVPSGNTYQFQIGIRYGF